MKHLFRNRAIIIPIVVLILLTTVFNAAKAERRDDGSPIIVSMGDSYSSGEGIPPFFGERLSADWLAHRSQNSWPGMLRISDGESAPPLKRDKNWFFVAASGAETRHFWDWQSKPDDEDPSKPVIREGTIGWYQLAPQTDILDRIASEGHKVDYVTMTIGGNDARFSKIITSITRVYDLLFPNGYTELINQALDRNGELTFKDNLYKAYKTVADKAPDAAIIVAGYPQLIDENSITANAIFVPSKIKDVNDKVAYFNRKIEELVRECHDQKGMNIYFVSVQDAFREHKAYSDEPFLEPIKFGPRSEDLELVTIASSYSMHPNKQGAKAYARYVQSVIDDLEGSKKSARGPWGNTYYEFIIKRQYLNLKSVSFGQDPGCIYFGLHDFDLNGIPELLIGNGVDAHMEGGCHVFTYQNEAIQYLGEITCWPGSYGDEGLYYYDNGTYTGLFWEEAFQGARYRNYYYLDQNGKLCTELVEMGEYDDWDHTEGYGTDYHLRQRTDDTALLEMSRDPFRIELVTYDFDIIFDKGWDLFVQDYRNLESRLQRPKGYSPSGSYGNLEVEVPPAPGEESTVTPTPGEESSITPTPGQSSKPKLLDKLLSDSHAKEIGMTFGELNARYGPMEFLYLGTEEPIEAAFANAPNGPVRYYFENVGDISQDLWDEASWNNGMISPSSAKRILSDTDICTGIGATFQTFGVSRLKDYKSGFTDDTRYFDELFGFYRYMVRYRDYDFYANCSEGSKTLKETDWVDIMLPSDFWPERRVPEKADDASREPVPPAVQDEPETETASKWHYDPYAALNSAEDVLNTIDGKGAIYVSKLLRNGGLTNIKKDGAGDLIDYLNKPKNWDGETIGKVVTDPSYSELEVGDVLCSVCSKDGDAGNYTNGHGKGKNLYYGIQVFFVSEVGPDYVRVYSKHNDRHNEIIRLSCNGGDFTDSCGKCGNSKNTRWIAFCFSDAVKVQQSKPESQPDKKALKAKEGGFNDTDEPMIGFFADGNGNRVPLGFGAYDDMDEWVAVGQANEIVCNTPDVEAYGFFDVDRDGIKELIMKTGTYEAEYKYEFFRYDIDYLGNWGWVGSIGGGHSELYDDNGSLIKDNSHMGSQTLVRVDMSGGKLKETVFAQYEIGEDEDYVDMGYKPVYLCTKNIFLDYLP